MGDNEEGNVPKNEGEKLKLHIFEKETQDAQERLKQQQATIKEFSREGLKMLRILLLMIGTPAAIIGALQPNTLADISSQILSSRGAIEAAGVSLSMNLVAGVTGFVFTMSIVSNVVAAGYEERGIHNLSNPEDLSEVLNGSPDSEKYYRSKLEKYKSRIEYNDSVLNGFETILTVGKATAVISIYGIVTILYVILTDSPVGLGWAATAALILLGPAAVTLWSLPNKYRKVDSLRDRGAIYQIDAEKDSSD